MLERKLTRHWNAGGGLTAGRIQSESMHGTYLATAVMQSVSAGLWSAWPLVVVMDMALGLSSRHKPCQDKNRRAGFQIWSERGWLAARGRPARHLLVWRFWRCMRFPFFRMRPCQTVTCLVTQCLRANLSVSWSHFYLDGLFHLEPLDVSCSTWNNPCRAISKCYRAAHRRAIIGVTEAGAFLRGRGAAAGAVLARAGAPPNVEGTSPRR